MSIKKIRVLKEELSKTFKEKNVQLIDWTHIDDVNSLIITLSTKSYPVCDEILPKLICIEISIVNKIFVIYQVQERKKVYNEVIKKIGYEFPQVSKLEVKTDNSDYLNIIKRIKSILHDFKLIEMRNAIRANESFSNIFLKKN